MGHHDLRHDKECQNCGHTVEVAYCSKCGQHNIETRQPFHHLITHTIEDITHYDSNFWKTIKYLLFRPGKLTIEYLLGHRMRYVAPVKLYIFISFVCFFIMALMAPSDEELHENTHGSKKTEHSAEPARTTPVVKKDTTVTLTVSDIFKKDLDDKKLESIKKEKDSILTIEGVKVNNIHQLDSLRATLKNDKKIPFIKYIGHRIELNQKNKALNSKDLVIALAHLLPKVLFIYMPIFAFWLWLFHGKRRWYFFDHGIFTLHYFSFLLLITTINLIISWLSKLVNHPVYDTIFIIIGIVIGIASCIYPFFYFFRAHSKFYGETKAISRLKSFLLFIINVILILLTTTAILFYLLAYPH
ncbi:DUF3667 domain-containing protein [Flavobacterium suzhouense]|uniref:DUF3667 domain-containing protein n=1 Tax=Flavobacterium suzhouense TaxID=1529638 RepID=A0ABW5NNA5_9FLAO